jgi:hypothetical protein
MTADLLEASLNYFVCKPGVEIDAKTLRRVQMFNCSTNTTKSIFWNCSMFSCAMEKLKNLIPIHNKEKTTVCRSP